MDGRGTVSIGSSPSNGPDAESDLPLRSSSALNASLAAQSAETLAGVLTERRRKKLGDVNCS